MNIFGINVLLAYNFFETGQNIDDTLQIEAAQETIRKLEETNLRQLEVIESMEAMSDATEKELEGLKKEHAELKAKLEEV